MQLTVTDKGDYTLAETDGPLDDSAADPIKDKLHPLIAAKGTKLIVDISGSPRVNSSGLAILVRLNSDANTNSSRIILASPAPFVANVLKVTKLNTFFTVCDSVSQAAEKLSE